MTPECKSDLRVRVASAADLPRLVATINAAFTVETFLEGTRTDFERLTEQMQRGEILLAEDGSGQLIGCVYTELRETGQRGYLGMLAVDPTHQRAGYGRAMMLAGEEHLRSKGCSAVDICVISWRTELPPIYRGFGYVETGIEEFRPSQGLKPGVGSCHCIVMTKTL